ncbi:signal transduction histidine kinase [Burkholderia sp. Ch1-1]|uniref:Virulence sensor protein BvgS n=1 Tax=Paraburkholderia dioscoreae TaxID=2604047 RepID=A0A5Q4ZEL8_9BURK|nr:signal transduction histidine kinase [Burkholderia sp. Ch1-1]VVD34101.1 Signal transduction histidine kinase [Paraburkholderia dioscoreae]
MSFTFCGAKLTNDIAANDSGEKPLRRLQVSSGAAFYEREQRRLDTLESLHILNTTPEPAYDRIVRRASEFFEVPMCVISFAGQEEQWFKARLGLDIDEAPRTGSFCEATLERNGVLIVPDARLSPRFAEHPFVTGPPWIRFYAGVPLEVEDGQHVGTLCIMDVRPRVFDQSLVDALTDFAAMVVDELHLRLRTIALERELRKQKAAEAEAIASQKARADFLAMVTHELRAPLNSIAGMVSLISQSGGHVPAEIGVEALRDSTDHLVRMINEVLDLAKLEASGFTFARIPFDVRRELRCALSSVRLQAASKGLRITLDIDSQVPAYLMGDRTRVSQIVLNLLGNAVKFTAHGEVNVRVRAEQFGSQRASVTIVVTDTGMGMRDQIAEALFSDFSQEASVKSQYGGTGLGLSICRKLVYAMAGTITASARPGGGAVFTCVIPFDIAEAPACVRPVLDLDNVARGDQLVLIADDDGVSRRVTQALIGRLGYQVEGVSTGRGALELLRTRPFDVAVLDINMPDLNGLALARELHEQTEFGVAVPLIALSGSPPPENDCRLALFDDYLVKPVSMQTLDDAIAKVLLRRRSLASGDVAEVSP